MSTPADNEFVARTDRIIEILRKDTGLQGPYQNVGEELLVYKGVRRLDTGRNSIWVHRRGTDQWGYWQGIEGADVVATWELTCICRHVGEPDELEDAVALLSVRVVRAIINGHKIDPLWDTAQVMPSQATTVRTEENQFYEIETIPVQLSWPVVIV